MEHDIDDQEELEEIKMPTNQSFPQVFDRFQSKFNFSKKKTTDQPETPKSSFKIENLQATPKKIDPNNLSVDEIHKENHSKINSMSLEEIKQAQKEILNLDPGLLEKLQFLAGKKKGEEKKIDQITNLNQNGKEFQTNLSKQEKPEKNESHFKKIQNYFSNNDKKRFQRKQMINNDKEWTLTEIDLKKMEWMSKNQEKPKSMLWNINEEELISLIRFGFDGEIIPINQEFPTGKSREGLHHHGDDQQNPGKLLKNKIKNKSKLKIKI